MHDDTSPHEALARAPSGTLTFLFTDIAGSTRLWEQYPTLMPAAFQRHETILRHAIGIHGGYAYKMVGDAFQAAFATAGAALAAALAAQRGLHAEDWGAIGDMRVRMALDSGVVEERGNDYVGPLLNRIARMLAAGHGGQILLSAATHELIWQQLPTGVSLNDLGAYQLRDIIRPERVFQVIAPDLPHAFPPLRASGAQLHNLPEPLTSFVGRSHELATTVHLLGTTRLLTLIGPGGTGKTRLSLALASVVRDQFSVGAWLVELAPLADPALVLPTLATALGLREEPGGLPLQRLLTFVREKQLLLVLDNCEHLIDTCAQLAEQLLRACPRLKILASSREPLRIAGEALFQVPALSVPNPRRLAPLDELARYEAVQLFVERARLVNSTFELTQANAAAIAQICAQLDGIPLAIELAAARLRLLTIAQIAARLGERFRLLTDGTRTALPRHQTLQALIDWSYNLLSEQERALLCHLAVFAGGWTLEAAEAVCTSEMISDVLDSLTHLVNKSMVQVEPGKEAARYRMLETIRQYALEKLAASGQADAARHRHADYYLALAEMAEEHLLWRTTRQTEWLARLEVEHDNLRAALSFCIESLEARHAASDDENVAGSSSLSLSLAEVGIRLAGALGTFWDTRGHLSEGRGWLARALAHSQTIAPAVRAKALNQAGRLAWTQDDTSAARQLFEESLGLYRKLKRQDEIANVLYNLGQMALANGDLKLAAALFDEGLALRRALGDKRGIAWTLEVLGEIARYQGEYARAAALAHEALALFESFSDSGSIAHAKWTLGHIARSQGDDIGAAAYYSEALALAQEVGDGWLIASVRHNQAFLALHMGDHLLAEALLLDSLAISREIEAKGQIAWDLAALGGVAAMRGQSERCARLLGAVEAWFELTGNYIGPTEQAEHDRYLTVARAQASAETFAKALTTGRAMSLEQALAYAIGECDN